MTRLLRVSFLLLLLRAATVRAASGIDYSFLPAYGSTSDLSGEVHGVDPADAATALRIVATERIGADNRITFSAAADKRYNVEFADSLSPATWTALATNVPGTDGPVQVIDHGGATQAGRFYRIYLIP